MRKVKELTDPQSCLSRAKPHEWLFVLLGRDITAPDVIRYWASRRIALAKNHPGDPQVLDALNCAAAMEREIDAVTATRVFDGGLQAALDGTDYINNPHLAWHCYCGRLNPLKDRYCGNCGKIGEGRRVWILQP